MFANASTIGGSPLSSCAEEQFDSRFNVKMKGMLYTVQKALPPMNNGASIILTGSVASEKAFLALVFMMQAKQRCEASHEP